MDTTERARTTARLLVELTRTGDLDGISRIVHLLTGAADPRRERLHQVLVELLDAAATMVLRQTRDLGSDTAVIVDLRRIDGSTVDIDQLRPEMRAIVRALLAKVNDCDEDLAIQLELAMRGEPDGLADGATLVLLWTVSAMTWCAENDEPAPGWLDRAA
jgi:hypothetical protein